MALREYRCAKCGATFERLIRSTDEERRVTCPECGERRVRRLISRFTAAGASRGQAAADGCGCGGSCACGRR
ncbi:MAG: zinc ribbon domain-containing protein [Thermoflexales bacterium]|nr:zinc ribbon domain-containing protein [Thermoflexales bacterium]MDW8352585.1 zinc ribbon domain-containing protein [Anaerolineae bacterium]